MLGFMDLCPSSKMSLQCPQNGVLPELGFCGCLPLLVFIPVFCRCQYMNASGVQGCFRQDGLWETLMVTGPLLWRKSMGFMKGVHCPRCSLHNCEQAGQRCRDSGWQRLWFPDITGGRCRETCFLFNLSGNDGNRSYWGLQFIHSTVYLLSIKHVPSTVPGTVNSGANKTWNLCPHAVHIPLWGDRQWMQVENWVDRLLTGLNEISINILSPSVVLSWTK